MMTKPKAKGFPAESKPQTPLMIEKHKNSKGDLGEKISDKRKDFFCSDVPIS